MGENGTDRQTRRIELAGHVQGVGFRPFVYRLAKQYQLSGWVRNEVGRVAILVQGPVERLESFCRDLVDRAPPLAEPRLVSNEPAMPTEQTGFVIARSDATADSQIHVPTDRTTCDDCLGELADPDDRRHGYPFVNCTNCGPRYTLIDAMPYDRKNTTMAAFTLCASCRSEYEDPDNRRFHAEPIACADCGPGLFHAQGGRRIAGDSDTALTATLDALREGHIVAVRGIGGYHLMCDAGSDTAVRRLRRRKGRPDKPLAVMFPATGATRLDAVRRSVCLSAGEADALVSSRRPIVLATRRDDCPLAPSVSPGLGELGVLLPYSPLHTLIVDGFGGPLVATSGNMSGEPVLTDVDEATRRLADIADAFLHHDRPIARPADDPVVRTLDGAPRPIRLGRGSAPLELDLAFALDEPVLAVGGHMKGAIALAWKNRIVVSPHIGEMNTPRSQVVFEALVDDLQALYGVEAARVVCDAHPGYTTHRWATRCGLPVGIVHHHHAHASAIAGEHPSHHPMTMFAWDGVGMGTDGSLWGGETFIGAPGRWHRVASLRPFTLPGGERAGREPWRSAAALCWELDRASPVGPADSGLVREAWKRGVNSPKTSAVGRLFDAAAAILLGIETVSHEAQGPMRIEALAARANGDDRREPLRLTIETNGDDVATIDWGPLLVLLLDTRTSPAARAMGLHTALAHNLLDQARWIRNEHGIGRVGLAGGVFQNRRLTDEAAGLLRGDGFTVLLADRVPCNDGGLCFGQVIEAAAGGLP